MGLGKVAPKEGKPAEPDPNETLAAEQARVRQLEAELEARRAAEAAQKEAYESALQQRFQAAQQVAPPPDRSAEFYAAQEELSITDEDLVENGAESVRKIAEYVAEKRSRVDQEKLLPIMSGLIQQSYRLQIKELSSNPFWEDLGPIVENYFAQNPDEMMKDGRVQGVFHELVGRNLPELQKRQEARQAEKGVESPPPKRTSAPALPSIRTAPAGRDVSPPVQKESSISAEEKYLMDSFNAYGADLDEQEWNGISKGQILPKSRRASDWQRGVPGDANVTNYASSEYDAQTRDDDEA